MSIDMANDFRPLRILQIHNVQSAAGGADRVIELEKELLEAHGNIVEQYFVDTKSVAKSKLRAGMKALWNRESNRALIERLSSFRPDIAHVHTPFPVLSPSVFHATHSMGVPTVETLHSHRMICVNALFQRNGKTCEECVGKKFPTPAIRHRCYHNSLIGSSIMASTLGLHHTIGTFQKCIDRYIALSPFAKDRLVKSGFPEKKICVKPNFVTADGSPGKGEGGHALFAGRFNEEKGVLTLIKAWEQTPPELKLVVIGDGPLRETLHKMAEGKNIEFRGWQSPAEVRSAMKSASMVIFPSEIYEAGPLVLIESYSCGTPVIASDIGNFSDQVRVGETGLLYRCGNPEDLASKISQLVSDSVKLQSMRATAYQEYQARYTPQVSYKNLREIYRQATLECESNKRK